MTAKNHLTDAVQSTETRLLLELARTIDTIVNDPSRADPWSECIGPVDECIRQLTAGLDAEAASLLEETIGLCGRLLQGRRENRIKALAEAERLCDKELVGWIEAAIREDR